VHKRPAAAVTEKRAKDIPSALPWGGLPALARIATLGAKKHGLSSWKDTNKYPIKGYVDAVLRHLFPILIEGLQATDEESGERHIHHLAWNALRLSAAVEQKEPGSD
jgi:hypothetical protein